jgi:Tfp pilus assembly protein PilO
MGRIPTFVIIIMGVVLILGLSALVFFVVLQPKREELAALAEQLRQEQEVAARAAQAQQELDRVKQEWLEAKARLASLMEARSMPISFGQPAAAMIALWYEYREDLAPLIERWITSTGCVIESDASFPAPPMTPPVAPGNGFLQVPEGQTITLTVGGSLDALERLYKSLGQLPRVVTVGQLVITGEGDDLRAQVPFKFYLLCEEPPQAAAPAAAPGAGAGAEAPGEMGMEAPPGEPGMPPGEGAGGASEEPAPP